MFYWNSRSQFDWKDSSYSLEAHEQKAFCDLKSRFIRFALNIHNKPLIAQLGSTSFGFITAENRQDCWALLLDSQHSRTDTVSDEIIDYHQDEEQVELDINRSFGTVKNEIVKSTLRLISQKVVVQLLRRHSQLRYYQGYHDVVAVFTLVYTSDKRSNWLEVLEPNSDFLANEFEKSTDYKTLLRTVESFTLLYLRDFVMDSLELSIDQLKLLPTLLKKEDKQLFKCLSLNHVEPFYAISSILTIYAHELLDDNSDTMFEIFDMVISNQSMIVPLIIFVNILVVCKKSLIQKFEECYEMLGNSDQATHVAIQHILQVEMKNNELWKKALAHTRYNYKDLSRQITPKMVNPYSVLTTTSSGTNLQQMFTQFEIDKILESEIAVNSLRNEVKKLKRDNLPTKERNTQLKLNILRYSKILVKTAVFVALLTLLFSNSNSFVVTSKLKSRLVVIYKFYKATAFRALGRLYYKWFDL